MRRGTIEQKIAILRCCLKPQLITNVIYKANLGFLKAKLCIEQLELNGCLNTIMVDGKPHLKITVKGINILRIWQDIEKGLLHGSDK